MRMAKITVYRPRLDPSRSAAILLVRVGPPTIMLGLQSGSNSLFKIYTEIGTLFNNIAIYWRQRSEQLRISDSLESCKQYFNSLQSTYE